MGTMFTPACLSFTLGRRRKPTIQKAQKTRTKAKSFSDTMSLDQYLKSFLETLWWQEAKVRAGDDVFQQEFDSLRKQSTPAGEKNAQHALKSVNRSKNRYKDIIPFDTSRVSHRQLIPFVESHTVAGSFHSRLALLDVTFLVGFPSGLRRVGSKLCWNLSILMTSIALTTSWWISIGEFSFNNHLSLK